MTATETDEIVETRLSDDPGECSHIVMVPKGEKDETPQAYVMRARVEGFPVTAVCGWTWIPQKDPKPLPVCSRCMEFYQTHGKDLDKRHEPPDA